ncbi:VOC family protein [Streptomyces catenulae]|uniref:VOC family protein n=1 Tax=Streptomyces catenulae TaxID=66875 RepID=A0ABV2YSI0_9ACTN|nr:VOC family protein [Streptomyces catenulae]
MSAAEHRAPATAAPTVPIHGAPCWVNLMTRDLRSTQDFYTEVLGWKFRPGSLGDEFCVALDDGRPVAGIAQLTQRLRGSTAWTPYFAVDSADDVAARVRERGATVAVGPLEFGTGRAALASDRDGAVFGFWEGQTLRWSVGRANAPACLELRTRDAFAAAIFYAEIFDWATQRPGGCDVTYEDEQVIVRQDRHIVATLRGGGVEEAPDPHLRPRWHVHFQVRDLPSVISAAVAAGGTVMSPAPQTGRPGGRSMICDPHGALFTVTDTPEND